MTRNLFKVRRRARAASVGDSARGKPAAVTVLLCFAVCAASTLGSCVSDGAGNAESALSEAAAWPVSPAPASAVTEAQRADAAPEGPPATAIPLPAPARLQLRERSDLRAGFGPVTAQAWRRDGATLLTADFDRIQRWDAPGARNLGAIAESGGLIVDFSLFESVSGKARLASASRDGAVTVWDPDDGSRLASVSEDADRAVWSPDGSRLTVCRTDGRVLVLAWPGLKTAAELAAGPGEAPLRAAWLASGKELLLGGASGTVFRWKPGEPEARPLGASPPAGTAESAGNGGGRTAILDLEVSPDGSRAAAALSDGTVTVLDLASGAVLAEFPAHRGAALSVAWSPDGSRLASGGADKQVRVWEAADGAPHAMQHHNSLPVRSVAWMPDGGFLSSGAGSMDLKAHTGATILWEVP